jgi:hypothetical protein
METVISIMSRDISGILQPSSLAALGLENLSYYALDRYGEGLNGIPTVALEEFPEVDEALLEKFTSFDPELGWCPRPNRQKQRDTGDHLPGEEVRTVVTYSTDEYGSRVCPAADRGGEGISVSTYGDSYCFCREVDDDETFQAALARRLDTHVGNYGAGNYGLDQALLRLRRDYEADPTDYVVMVVTASSIARILSVWKHYQEFGNVLAVKPRFVRGDDGLELVETPIDEKRDLLDLEAYADFFHEYDEHYERWFKPRLLSPPYADELLDDPDVLAYVVHSALAELEDAFDLDVPGQSFGRRITEATVRLDQTRVAYHERLFDERGELFEDVVGEFVSFAREKGFTPVFAMVQQLRYATYEETHGPIYDDLVERLDAAYPELVAVDVPRHLDAGGDVESLYVQRGEGGHYSPETNEAIADVLVEEVFG